MSDVKRPVIPAEVADTIENLRGRGKDNSDIVYAAMRTGGGLSVYTVSLQKIPFDTLLAALVNGYEREKTPEESVADMYANLKQSEQMHLTFYGGRPEGYTLAARCVKSTLDTLGIKIEGVNA